MTKRRPPARWLALHTGDMIHTRSTLQRIDSIRQEMEGMGYTIEVEKIKGGHRITCTRSPHDRPKRPQLRIV